MISTKLPLFRLSHFEYIELRGIFDWKDVFHYFLLIVSFFLMKFLSFYYKQILLILIEILLIFLEIWFSIGIHDILVSIHFEFLLEEVLILIFVFLNHYSIIF